MIIKNFLVKHGNGKTIRDIQFFRSGLNLIVNEDKEEKGNNIGKTTVLRCIDYCLGSDGKDIYEDKEQKSNNQLVLSFLYDNNVSFELHLENREGKDFLLRRSFGKDSKICYINGEPFSFEEYKNNLNKIIFNNPSGKPTFRKLIHKFLRDTDHSMSNLLKYDDPNTSDREYERSHLFLFGFGNVEILTSKLECAKELKIVIDQIKSLKQTSNFKSDSELKQSLIVLDNKILSVKNQIDGIQIYDGVDTILIELKETSKIASELRMFISKLEIELSLNQKSKGALQKELEQLDVNYIGSIYEQAKSLIPSIQKTFEEVVVFHKKIVQNRIDLIQKSIRGITSDLNKSRDEYRRIIDKQQRLDSLVTKKDCNTELDVLKNELNSLYEERGNIWSRLELLKSLQEKKESLQKDYTKISDIYKEELVDVEKKLGVFNKYFSKWSEKVFGKSLIIFLSEKDSVIKFQIDNLSGNDGSGEKKSQIAIFDFSYSAFLNELKIDGPNFVLHDNIESKDPHHLKLIFEIANIFGGQYIVPILRDKLNSVFSEEQIEKHRILSLSIDDKFLKIEEFSKEKGETIV